MVSFSSYRGGEGGVCVLWPSFPPTLWANGYIIRSRWSGGQAGGERGPVGCEGLQQCGRPCLSSYGLALEPAERRFCPVPWVRAGPRAGSGSRPRRNECASQRGSRP